MVIPSMSYFPSFQTISYHFPCFCMFPLVFVRFPWCLYDFLGVSTVSSPCCSWFCCKKFISMLKVVTKTSISGSNTIFLLSFVKVWPILIQNNMYCQWIKIKKTPTYNFCDNIGNLSIAPFWYHSYDIKRNPWVILCSHGPINDSSS